MNYVDSDSVLTNRYLSFGTTIGPSTFQITVDDSTTTLTYTAGQRSLQLGDPYDGLFFIETKGCQLN
jgi:hypothetical protein